ncbi:MAG: beta-ketoacyl-[acyl-carrier-protein] synthase family protein [Aureispira sp.]
MQQQAIYCLADNLTTALGFTTADNLAKMKAEQTGVQEHDLLERYHKPVWISKIDSTLEAYYTTKIQQANKYTRLERLFIWSIQEAAQQLALDLRQKDTLLIIASTKGNIDVLDQAIYETDKRFPKERSYLGAMARAIQTYFQNPNTPVVICNACISGVLALDVAKRYLRAGRYQQVVVAGGDLVTRFTLSGFQAFKAMSEAPCKPFDVARSGINLGEGVGTMILGASPREGDVTPIILRGGASSNDANHISGPSRTGAGLSLAIQKAFKDAQSTADEMDYLSMHGTATPYNDEMEAKALAAAKLQAVPLNSLKGYLGHTLGAAGLIESIVATWSLRQNQLYRSLGFENLGVSVPLNIISQTQQQSLQSCLKTASGFGGCNAAVVFSKQL